LLAGAFQFSDTEPLIPVLLAELTWGADGTVADALDHASKIPCPSPRPTATHEVVLGQLAPKKVAFSGVSGTDSFIGDHVQLPPDS
jgi:hypothetical protein